LPVVGWAPYSGRGADAVLRTKKPVSTNDQRAEQAGAQELVERLSAGDLDDAAEHVDRHRVVPSVPG